MTERPAQSGKVGTDTEIAARAPSDVGASPISVSVPTLLGELEGVLARQVESLRTGALDVATRLGDRVGVLLGRLNAVAPRVAALHTERLRRIRTLHRTLGLMLAQRKSEHAQQQTELARGKSLARAYGQHAWRET